MVPLHEHTIVDAKNLSFKEALSLKQNFQFWGTPN